MEMEDYELWIKKAEEDFDTALYNLKGDKIEAGAFFLQQSAEKALKAIYIKKFKKLLKTHDLVLLSKNVSAPKEIIKHCEKLTIVYSETRYPDTGLEEDIKEEIENLKNSATEILKWTKKNL